MKRSTSSKKPVFKLLRHPYAKEDARPAWNRKWHRVLKNMTNNHIPIQVTINSDCFYIDQPGLYNLSILFDWLPDPLLKYSEDPEHIYRYCVEHLKDVRVDRR